MNSFKKLIMLLVLFTGLTVSTAKAADLGNGFNLGVTSYMDYSYATGDHFDPNSTQFTSVTNNSELNKGLADGFHFTRVYLTLKKQVNDDLMVRVTTDQMTVRPDGSSEATPFGLSGFAGSNRGNVFVKYAYGEYILNPSMTVRFGLTQTPWIDEAENRWTLRFLRPTFWDEQGAITSSDLGVSLLGSVANKLVTYHLMVSNGEGYENSNVNGQGNAVQGRVDLNLGGFTLSAFGLTESAVGNGAARSNWNEDREIFYVQYTDPMFRISAEYMMADDETNPPLSQTPTITTLATSTGSPRFNQGRGMGAWAWTKIPGFESARLFGRYYAMTPNSARDVGKMTEINAGITYEVNSNLSIALDDTMITQTLTDATNSPALKDFSDSIIGLRAQLSF
ncbi:MAG TPA: hypothetical protein VN944_03990 [Nitrospiria bacterium]|nr:hypothetical protein [Nitrospiria bacterium]